MLSHMKRALSILLAASAALSFGQVDPARVLLVVNGQKITGQTYYKRMEVLPNVGRMASGQFLEAMPGFLTMQALINELLILQAAKEKGVEPTPAQIDAELKIRQTDNPDYVKAFTMLGFTEDDVKYDIKVALAEFNLTTMGINIADQQVSTYYKDRIADFTMPKRYRLRVIAVGSPEKKQAVDKELAAGKKFADVATAMSEDLTSKFDGGLMGDVPELQLGPNIKPLVVGLKEGASTVWLQGQNGTEIKLFLEKVIPEETLPLDDKMKRAIRKKLMVERGQVRNNVPAMVAEMRKKAKVEYQNTPFDEQLKQIFSSGG